MKPMTDEHALLQAVLDVPEDDAPRLVYADYMEEHAGDPDRAYFIRAMVKLARTPKFLSLAEDKPGKLTKENGQVKFTVPNPVHEELEAECRKLLGRDEHTPGTPNSYRWLQVPEPRLSAYICRKEESPPFASWRRGWLAEIAFAPVFSYHRARIYRFGVGAMAYMPIQTFWVSERRRVRLERIPDGRWLACLEYLPDVVRLHVDVLNGRDGWCWRDWRVRDSRSDMIRALPTILDEHMARPLAREFHRGHDESMRASARRFMLESLGLRLTAAMEAPDAFQEMARRAGFWHDTV